MELPSINSTTSISDNADLRNHYEKLLFKNQSGNSLSDLPHSQLRTNQKGNGINKPSENFDFISGFKHPLSNPSTSSNLSQVHSSKVNFNTNSATNQTTGNASFQLQTERFNNEYDSNNHNVGLPRHFSYPENKYMVNPQVRENNLGSINNNISWNQEEIRRYSVNGVPFRGQFSSNDPNYTNNIQVTTNVTNNLLRRPNQFSRNSNNLRNGPETIQENRSLSNGWLPKGNEPMSNQMGEYSTNQNMFKNPTHAQDHYIPNSGRGMRDGMNQNFAENFIQNGINYDLDTNVPQRDDKLIMQQTNITKDNITNGVNIDNGLLLVNSKDILSSSELHQLYKTSGTNYFSSNYVYPFIDYVKEFIKPLSNQENEVSSVYIDQNRKQNILQFLSFLQSCNSNFLNQHRLYSKSYGSSTGNNSDNNKIGLQSQGLVLVALKNGKIELLSIPQNTNLRLKRGDLVITDGDRGKDLVQVIEPDVSLDLALFANFLKKKVHFDSLITAKHQHYPNGKFIQALINSRSGVGEKLNTKIYDIIELTQLIVPSKQVLRFATPWEVMTNLQHKLQDELKALHIAQLKLQSLNSSRMNAGGNNLEQHNDKKGLNIKILNSEFQFDRKKLTFYYICEERNDFRELIKELFKFYKTRIWLCAIPNNLNIDSKYYDMERKELKVYEQMLQNQNILDGNNPNQPNSFALYNPATASDEPLVIPPLNKIELDNFQIGIYKELLHELF